MSSLRRPVGKFVMIDSCFDSPDEFNDEDEEERYQAFKERLMRELGSLSKASVPEKGE